MQPSRNAAEPVAPAEASARPSPAAPLENPYRGFTPAHEDRLAAAGIVTQSQLVRRNRRLNAISIGVPAIGSLAALALLPVAPPTLSTLAIFAVLFFIQSFGLSIGLHRYFTHRSFRPARWFAICLAVAGTWAFQGPIARWVADHRRHHRFSDAQFDPHSPYWTDEGPIRGSVRGWAHAHLSWMLTGRPSCETRYAKDVHADPVESWVSRNYWLVASSGLVLPALVGFAVGGPGEALTAFLWAGCLRVAILHQITWSVNSFGHMFGTKVEGSRDQSRNNLVLTILMIGEGLHSHHHRFPQSAVNQPAILDASGWALRLLARLGVVDLGGARS
ncbi:MAG: acyl-CoA desaturase [Parvularculaceae bacterium]